MLMPNIKVYNIEGKVVGERELPAGVFGVKVNPNVIHEVVVANEANAREPWAHTKTKGEVRGGGKKPWRQKGTGRARQGSTRNPQWIGGGVAFGPRSDRDYSKKLNRKTKARAFCMMLSDKAANERLVLVEGLSVPSGKTKQAVGVFGKLPVKGKLAVVVAGGDAMLSRSTRNLKTIRYATVSDVSLMDVIGAEYLVLSTEATDVLVKKYGSKA
jgi:large subunit ribosomal protein L4